MKRFTVAVVAISGCILGPACQAIVGIGDRVEAPPLEDAGATDDVVTPPTNEAGGSEIDAPADVVTEVSPPLGCPTGCLPPAPSGWKGPSALFEGAPVDKPTECPSNYDVNELETHVDMTFGPATCDCGAVKITGRYCSSTVNIHNVGPCKDLEQVQGQVLSNGVCFKTTAASAPGGYYLSNPTLVPGSCTYPNAKTTLPPPTFGKVQLACGRAQVPACAGRSDCVDAPAVGAPFERLCIYKDGEEACPSADYPKQIVAYKKVEEARSCTACTGGAPTGGVCGTQWGLSSGIVSCASDIPPTTNSTDTCYTYPGPGAYINTGAMGPSTGTCGAPSGGAPAGDVKSAEAVTYCCNQ